MKLNDFLLKYFYSWYTIPIIYLHESLHYLMALILKVKVTSWKKTKIKPNLITLSLTFEYTPKYYKMQMINYAPLLMFLSFILMFFIPVFIYISIYLVTTIFIYNKKIIWVALPSTNDKKYYKFWKYQTYLINSTSLEKFKTATNLTKFAKENHLLTRGEYYVFNKW